MRTRFMVLFLLSVLNAPGIVWRSDVEAVATKAEGEMKQVGQLLYSPLRVFGGSCIAIGGEWVLTSRHGTDKWTAEFLRVRFTALDGVAYQVRRIVLPKSGDFALLELEKAVPGVKKIVLHAGDQEVGKRVWIGGFGLSGPARKITGRGKFHAGHNRIDKIRNGKLTISLSRPDDATAEKDESTISLLDSGSPMFVETGDGWELAGIASTASNSADPGYGDRGSYARVSTVRKWIMEKLGTMSVGEAGGLFLDHLPLAVPDGEGGDGG